MLSYKINEIFYSIQGEGRRSGTPNVFVRFSNCNLACKKEGPAGFDCDTEFESGRTLSLGDVLLEIDKVAPKCGNIIFTGGEPCLQIDEPLIRSLKALNRYIAIETNGTIKNEWAERCDWISVSPKSAEHTLRISRVNELRYVRHEGQGIPQPSLQAQYLFISPAFEVDGTMLQQNLKWCMKLVKENPEWSLSIQQHKLWKVR